MEKTIAELIDELSIVNIKIYMLNNVMLEDDDRKVADAGRKMVALMSRRSALKNAIGERLHDSLGEVKEYTWTSKQEIG